jgi:hypothetical protein
MREQRKRTRIDEELVCADCLVHCLKAKYGCTDVLVARSDADPPDFWITVDGKEFAAEVTSIVHQQGYRADCIKLKDQVMASSKSRGLLEGKYLLYVERDPMLARTGTPERHGLIQAAVSFIRATGGAQTTPEVLLLKDRHGKLTISKVSSRGASVGLMAVVGARWEGDVQDELRDLIQAAVHKKRGALERKGVPARCPRTMLLLYDAYGFGDLDDAQGALLKADGYDWFHSVFWAASFTDRPNELSPENPGRLGVFLYSRNRDWWQQPAGEQC